MRCERCGNPIAIYELYPRSYRLYMYVCTNCKIASLAHHFDLELDIYHIEDEKLRVKKREGLVFVEGLEVEPRVFGFSVEDGKAIVVGDETSALGELAYTQEGVKFAPYSERAKRKLIRLLGLKDAQEEEIAARLHEILREAHAEGD